MRTPFLLFSLAIAPTLPSRSDARDATPVFTAASQYTAVLEQQRGRWHLMSTDGTDLIVEVPSRGCRVSHLPRGIWLLTRDAAGHASLVAPSVTSLPIGHPDSVALLPCGEHVKGQPFLSAPSSLIELLSDRVGAIRVEA